MYAFQVIDDWTGNATYYESLDEIGVDEGDSVRIFQVLCNEVEVLPSELITWVDGNWKKQYPGDKLYDLIKDGSYERVDKDDLILYKGTLFHCGDALLNYLYDNDKLSIVNMDRGQKKSKKSSDEESQ